jgi:hypothetical protein
MYNLQQMEQILSERINMNLTLQLISDTRYNRTQQLSQNLNTNLRVTLIQTL